jgi:hypothetical protein
LLSSIIQLMGSVMVWLKVIPLSVIHCYGNSIKSFNS